MTLTNTDIEQFTAMYKLYFGIDLSKDEARHKLSMLVTQFDAVYKPIKRQQLNYMQQYEDVYEQETKSSPKR